MTMAYLPVPLVRLNFSMMFTSNTVRRLMGQFPAIAQFINYFEANYSNGVFKPKLWNVSDRDVDFRTNNNVEGYTYVDCIFQRYVNLVALYL
jgi:hypothetical protein